jgi:hypothetical protein
MKQQYLRTSSPQVDRVVMMRIVEKNGPNRGEDDGERGRNRLDAKSKFPCRQSTNEKGGRSVREQSKLSQNTAEERCQNFDIGAC